MKNKRNQAIVLISHQERIMSVADRIIVIANGKIREEGSRDEVFPKLLGEFDGACNFRGKGEN